MADKFYVIHEDGTRLIEPDHDFAEVGDEVLRIELPNGDTHYVNSGELDFHWDVRDGGTLDLLNLADGERRTLRSYGQWVFADVVPFENPSSQIW